MIEMRLEPQRFRPGVRAVGPCRRSGAPKEPVNRVSPFAGSP